MFTGEIAINNTDTDTHRQWILSNTCFTVYTPTGGKGVAPDMTLRITMHKQVRV